MRKDQEVLVDLLYDISDDDEFVAATMSAVKKEIDTEILTEFINEAKELGEELDESKILKAAAFIAKESEDDNN